MTLAEQLTALKPYNEQEARDRETLLTCLATMPDVLCRTSLLAHFSASAWVVNARRDRVLMAYHNLYRAWSWLGGHADGESDLLAVALREVREESGVQDARPVMPDVFSVEVLTVDGHEKRGVYVPSHLHLNVTYLIEADDTQPLHIKPDENSGLKWFTPAQAEEVSSEAWMCERIYRKLGQKLRALQDR